MIELVLLRHGQSVWNAENCFTGWADVDLTPRGIEEARQAGRLLERAGYTFDVAYTSLLKRAIRTLWLVLDEMDLMWIPVHRSWGMTKYTSGGGVTRRRPLRWNPATIGTLEATRDTQS